MIKFKSPAVERKMTHLSQSVLAGLLITLAIIVFVIATDHGDSTLPIEIRNPLAWVFMWPTLLWDRILSDDASLDATFLTNWSLYSFVAYQLIKYLAQRKTEIQLKVT